MLLSKIDFTDCNCTADHKGLCINDLHDYQHESVKFLVSRKKGALWLDMGLGKSPITLTTVNHLLKGFAIDKTLIVAPKLVAQTTWHSEIKKWCHLKHLTYSICVGSKSERVAGLSKKADVYIINRDALVWLIKDFYGITSKSLAHKFPFDCLVLDESSSFKNYSAKRSGALRLVADEVDFIFELTGTPAPQGYLDLYSQMELLSKGMLAPNYQRFKMQYFYQLPTRALKIKDGAEAEMDELMKPYVLTMKSVDYLKAIDRVDVPIPLPLTPKLLKIYKEFEKDLVLEAGGATISEIVAVNKGVLSMKLRQFSSGWVYSNDDPPIPEAVHSLKKDALKELIEDQRDTMVIVYNFKFEYSDIVDILPKGSWCDGKVDGAIQAFQEGKFQYILLHPMSASMGLNLQEVCHKMLWYSPTWNLEESLQMDARIDRQGQKETCMFFRFGVGAVETDIVNTLSNKDLNMQKLMDVFKPTAVHDSFDVVDVDSTDIVDTDDDDAW